MFNDYQDKYLNIGDLELHYLEWGWILIPQ